MKFDFTSTPTSFALLVGERHCGLLFRGRQASVPPAPVNAGEPFSPGRVTEKMPLNRKTRRQLREHCNELCEDDALDPREFFKPPRQRAGPDRKTLQLCSQVQQTLAMVLAGEMDDELLQDLQIELVTPAPNASQLAVTLRANYPIDESLAEEIRRRLDRAAGRLRFEVAAAITRRRAPKLVFYLIGQ